MENDPIVIVQARIACRKSNAPSLIDATEQALGDGVDGYEGHITSITIEQPTSEEVYSIEINEE